MTMGTVPHFKKKWFLCCQARRWTVASVLYQDGRHVGETNLISALLALWLAQPALDVGGDSTCPSPSAVRERLGEITDVGAATSQSDRHRANLSSVGGKVHVELLGEDGRLLAERTLEQTGSCSDLSEAAAVVLSTWEAEFNPHIAASVVLPPSAASVRAETSPAVVAKAHAPEAPLRFDVGLALLGSIAGGEVVPGAKLEGSLFPTSSRLGLGAALSASSTHSQSVDSSPGDVHWMRVALTVGPKYRLGQRAASAPDCVACGPGTTRRRGLAWMRLPFPAGTAWKSAASATSANCRALKFKSLSGSAWGDFLERFVAARTTG